MSEGLSSLRISERGMNRWLEDDGSPNLELRTLNKFRIESLDNLPKRGGSHKKDAQGNFNYVFERMIEEFPDKSFTKLGLQRAYHNNKHRIVDEEE